MAEFYVRKSGNNGNLGNSASAAWATLQKALSGGTGNYTASSSSSLTTSTALVPGAWVGATVTAGSSTGIVQSNSTTTITLTAAGWTGGTPSASGSYSITHLSAGDTLWIGAGVYAGAVSITLTDPTSTVRIVGDTDGAKTGDGGEVIIAGNKYGPNTTSLSTSVPTILVNGRSYVTLEGLTILGTDNSSGTFSSGATCVNLSGAETYFTLRKCVIISPRTGSDSVRLLLRKAHQHVIEDCLFYSNSNNATLSFFVELAAANYSANIVVQRCLFLGGTATYGPILFAQLGGSGSGQGGGVTFRQCTNMTASANPLVWINNSTICGVTNGVAANPIIMHDCVVNISSVAQASIVGQIIDLGGNWSQNGFTNVQSNPRSFLTSAGRVGVSYALSTGYESLSGRYAKTPGFPVVTPPRAGLVGINGVFSAGSATTLTTSGLLPEQLKGTVITILSGTGAGSKGTCTTNTATTITVSGWSGTTPSGSGRFTAYCESDITGKTIYEGGYANVATGTLTGATAYGVYDRTKAWGETEQVGRYIYLTGGTGNGQLRMVAHPREQARSTAYAQGEFVISQFPSTGWVYECTVAGTTSASAIVWPTAVDGTITDGTVTWKAHNSSTVLVTCVPSTSFGSDGPWVTIPDNTTQYLIYDGPHAVNGKATSATVSTLVNNTSYATNNKFQSATIEITGGTGVGQKRVLASNNTSGTFTIAGGPKQVLSITGSPVSGNLSLQYGQKAVAVAYNSSAATVQAALEGLATIGSGNVVCTGGPLPGTPITCDFTGGVLADSLEPLITYTATSANGGLSTGTPAVTANWVTTPDSTSTYAVYRGDSLFGQVGAAGAITLHNTGKIETSVVDSGVSIRIDGPGTHEFKVPVKAQSTVISVKNKYDSNHGTANKPQLILLANAELGLSEQTITASNGANSAWETLSLSSFTPSKAGVVTVRLVSRAATPFGSAYFDTFSVT